MIKTALDSNIILYIHDNDDREKQETAKSLLAQRPLVSVQVISEYLNVMKRSFPVSKTELMDFCSEWMIGCTIHPISITTLQTAKRLIKRYDFQIFDSIIVASALEAGCKVLYSEDMQHNLLVEKQLTIINPFI